MCQVNNSVAFSGLPIEPEEFFNQMFEALRINIKIKIAQRDNKIHLRYPQIILQNKNPYYNIKEQLEVVVKSLLILIIGMKKRIFLKKC